MSSVVHTNKHSYPTRGTNQRTSKVCRTVLCPQLLHIHTANLSELLVVGACHGGVAQGQVVVDLRDEVVAKLLGNLLVLFRLLLPLPVESIVYTLEKIT